MPEYADSTGDGAVQSVLRNSLPIEEELDRGGTFDGAGDSYCPCEARSFEPYGSKVVQEIQGLCKSIERLVLIETNAE